MSDGRPRFRLIIFTLACVCGLVGCSGPTTLQTASMTDAPTVDGALDDWSGSLTYVKEEPVAMSVAPTDSVLYVAISVQNRRMIRSIAARGLIVWVDPAGGTNHTYGVRYPLGLSAQRAQQGQVGGDADRSSSSSADVGGLDQVSLAELDILRTDSTRRRIPAHFSSGLRAKATINPGALVYELAIPVGTASAPGTERGRHGLRKPLGSAFGIGLVSPDSDEDDLELPEGMGGMPSVTGRGGGRRTPRPGRTGRRGRRQQPSPSPETELPTLEIWTKVVNRTTG